MLRVALRATDREYEIDHWYQYAPSMETAKMKAQTHATKTGQGRLVWKESSGTVVASLGRNFGYYIERYHDSDENPAPVTASITGEKSPTRGPI